MPTTKEFVVQHEDRPGTLGKLCRALADQNINILAFQPFPSEKGKSSIHLIVDNQAAAKAVFDNNAQSADLLLRRAARNKFCSHRDRTMRQIQRELREFVF